MSDTPTIRLNKVLRDLNISLDRAVDHLKTKGVEIEARPTTKISSEVYQVLLDEFQTDMSKKVASQEVGEEQRKEKEALRLKIEQEQEEKRIAREKKSEEIIKAKAELSKPKAVGKIDLEEGAFSSNWKAGLRISYQFSNKISGGLRYEYRESDSRTMGEKIDRDFGFDINIAITG